MESDERLMFRVCTIDWGVISSDLTTPAAAETQPPSRLARVSGGAAAVRSVAGMVGRKGKADSD